MDLGFGGANHRVGSATARAIVQTAHAQESAIQGEIDQYDSLLDDATALQQLRAKRLQEMALHQKKRQEWQAAGHGTYQELVASQQDARDVAKEFFDATKQSECLVVHFYRPSTPLCDVFHKHLTQLAPKHLETRFLKLNVQDADQTVQGASFLVERLGIVIMPTLVLVKNRKVVHHVRGFDELGGTEDFSSATLEYVLGVHGVLEYDVEQGPPKELVSASQEGVNAVRIRRGRNYEDEEEEDF